jgi:hypothetical protein
VKALHSGLQTIKFSSKESAERHVERYLKAVSGLTELVELRSNSTAGFEVSIVTSDADLSSITRRASLIASELIVAHANSGIRSPIWSEEIRRGGSHQDLFEDNYSIDCPSVSRLGEWLSAVAPLLRAGRLIYFPHIHKQQTIVDSRRFENLDQTGHNEDIYRSRSLMDIVMRDGRVISLRDDARIGSRLLVPLLTVDLPYIEGTSLRDFAHVVTEEWESWESARDFLRARLLDLLGHNDEQELAWAAARIGVELSEGVRATYQDLARVSRRSAVQAAGGVLATAAATLVAVSGAAFGQVAQILGAAGGAWSLVSAYSQYKDDKSKVQTRPFYLLWLLSRRRESKFH